MRILTLDIETRPPLLWGWGLHDQNFSLEQIAEPGYVICFAAKWLDEKEVLFFSEYDEGGRKAMIQAARDLLDEADVVVHFNGTSFDTLHLNGEFEFFRIPRPSPYINVDLMRVVKKNFRQLSNKLAWTVHHLGVGEKMKHEGFELWRGWMEGHQPSINKMRRYNIQDTRVTERLFKRLDEGNWIPNIPGRHLEEGDGIMHDSCPKCGSFKREKRGFSYTLQSKFQRYRCLNCLTYYRDSRRVAGTTSKGLS